MTKTFKCPNCSRVFEKPDDTVMVMCPCGYEAVELKRSPLSNDLSKDDKLVTNSKISNPIMDNVIKDEKGVVTIL